jgi:hypothetical protein
MLASSGDEGYNTLENYTNDTGKTVEILDKILVTIKTAAQNILTFPVWFNHTTGAKCLTIHPSNQFYS